MTSYSRKWSEEDLECPGSYAGMRTGDAELPQQSGNPLSKGLVKDMLTASLDFAFSLNDASLQTSCWLSTLQPTGMPGLVSG